MPETGFNLLEEPVFEARRGPDRVACLSLPEIFAALSSDTDLEFTHLQSHQMHAWHAFLVQLAALALQAVSHPQPFKETGDWRVALERLTTGNREPWCLVVTDLSKPALLQPPVPEGSIDTWIETGHPDELDLLVTAKNHDVKRTRMARARPDHWVYALVSVQTMDGFAGRNNYGISRMNGGYANRPCITTARDLRTSTRFRRDLSVIQEQRHVCVESLGFAENGGCGLVWILPWNGRDSIGIADLDPFFIEICRRVRLQIAPTGIIANRIGSAARRIDAEERRGDVGDPWIPIRREDHAALAAKGLAYTTLHEAVFDGTYKLSPATHPRPEDGESPILFASVLARGQGQTEGLHQREIFVPRKGRALFSTAEGRARLGLLARSRVDRAATTRRRILRPALLSLVQGAPDKLDYEDARVDSYVRQFDVSVDEVFFRRLFADADRDPEAAELEFTESLIGIARSILEDAIRGLPIPTARRYRALSRAEAVFRGASRRAFPELVKSREESSDGTNKYAD